MKPLNSILAAALLLGISAPLTQAAVEVSVDFFHDSLDSYGDWREVGDYGYVWQPRDVDQDWRPYSDGRWLYTDAGWTWSSDEPYSWAVYHYGRWARVNHVGWVWIPGTEWGPAWVSWRRSPHHVGWAPLPPDAQFSHEVGFNARVDADYDIGPTNYSFVEVRNFGAPRLRTVIIAPQQNLTIIAGSTNITHISYTNNVVYNEGPNYDVISRESAQPIRRMRLDRREQFDGDVQPERAEQFRNRVEGDTFHVTAIPFAGKSARAPRKVAAKVEKAEVDRGWQNAGPPAEVEKVRGKIKNEPAAKVNQERQANPDKITESTPPIAPAPTAAPAPATTAPAPAPAADTRPGKGNRPKGNPSPIPSTPPAATVAPEPPNKVVEPEKAEKPAKPTKGAQTSKPDVTRPPLPTSEEPAPAPKPKKAGNQGRNNQPPSSEAPPQVQVPEPKPKRASANPSPSAPDRQDTPQNKPESRPQSQPPARNRDANHPPEGAPPRSETKQSPPHPQAAPRSNAPQPAEGKPQNKGKGKKQSKDDEKTSEATQ